MNFCDKITKTDVPHRLSNALGREEGRKARKMQRKRKSKQPDKQLPLVLITLASTDHRGSCSVVVVAALRPAWNPQAGL